MNKCKKFKVESITSENLGISPILVDNIDVLDSQLKRMKFKYSLNKNKCNIRLLDERQLSRFIRKLKPLSIKK